MEKLSEQVRRAIRESEYSCYAIAKATGVDKSTISRFMSGKRTLSMACMDRIGAFLGLKIVRAKRRKGHK